jgi:hypothetical protein
MLVTVSGSFLGGNAGGFSGPHRIGQGLLLTSRWTVVNMLYLFKMLRNQNRIIFMTITKSLVCQRRAGDKFFVCIVGKRTVAQHEQAGAEAAFIALAMPPFLK